MEAKKFIIFKTLKSLNRWDHPCPFGGWPTPDKKMKIIQKLKIITFFFSQDFSSQKGIHLILPRSAA